MNDGVLPQPQPRGKPLPRGLPRGLSLDSRLVQHVPDDVFQKLQRQGEKEKERGGESQREAPEGKPQASQTPLTLPAADSAHSTPTPSPSLLGHRSPQLQDSPGSRRRGQPRRRSSPLSLSLRSVSRSRTPTPQSWPRPPEAVSSQFLGGCAEADAHLLDHARSDPSMSLSDILPTPLETPSSQRSAPTLVSIQSNQSKASSFAYFLRRNRVDRRLLKKRSRPTQHQEKKQPPEKQPEPPRSSSYYKPRIVEDSAQLKAPAPRPRAPSSPRSPSTVHSRSSSRQSIRWLRPVEATPSPAVATKWDDVVAESRPLGHSREFSTPTPMSPLSTPRSLRRPRPVRREERLTSSEANERSTEDTVHSSNLQTQTGAEIPQKAKDVPKRISLTGQASLSWLPTEMRRVTTPPLPEDEGKKHGALRSFFSDMRSLPAEHSSNESTSSARLQINRRKPILPRKSLHNLLTKLSIPSLKHKLSHRDIDSPAEGPDPFQVTHFEQTPFSQRYGDTRRDEMNRFRTYLDEALRESEDEDSGTAIFEFDVPDHLPNSPLCPLSSKHKSGGKGICPLHGRKKSAMMSARPALMARRQKTGPVIVYDSGEQPVNGTWKIDLDEEMARAMRP